MSYLKDLNGGIASVKATQKITEAKQMVAAAKLRRAQAATKFSRPYAGGIDKALANHSATKGAHANGPRLLLGTGEDHVHRLIVATGECGLAGGFNSSIIRLAREHALALTARRKSVKILTIGCKGNDVLHHFRDVQQLGFAQADEVASKVIDMFDADEFDIATLFFAHFQSTMSQRTIAQQLIPGRFEAVEPSNSTWASRYETEPSEEALLEELPLTDVSVPIYRALLETNASFYGAQMSAMADATRNAGEMISKLTLAYDRHRQPQITNELIEIISGAAAVEMESCSPRTATGRLVRSQRCREMRHLIFLASHIARVSVHK